MLDRQLCRHVRPYCAFASYKKTSVDLLVLVSIQFASAAIRLRSTTVIRALHSNYRSAC